MHALVYTGTNKIDFRKEKDPIAKPGEIIVKVKASGICGSDMHAFHGNDERRVPPLILGHEVSGTSLDGKFKNKDVVINPLISCENCEYCKNEREHLCPERTMIGMSTPIKREGGLAELVSVPEKNIFEVPNELSIKEAALAEPTAVALHAVLLAEQNLKKPLPECKILIQGAGAIGLLCGLVLNKEKKATNIVMSDPNKKRLDECGKYLKANFVSPDDKSIKENNFDLILESVGLEVTRHQAIKSIAPGGTILHIGLTHPSGTFDFKKLTIQEVTLVGTYCYTTKDFQKTLEILKEKKLGDLGWIEYRDLKKGSEAFLEIHNGTCVAPKIILIP
ncbi:alcohol dehydrogenase catalytic domain-containing protein [Candidatus Pelagibacter bacterium]|nr:alcohol dehydrogenase catalytic domain-containing protein [Candidatus Pelagibacter bacterium]